MRPALITLVLTLLPPFLATLSSCSQESYFSSGLDSRRNGASENSEGTGLVDDSVVEEFADSVADTVCTDDSADAACIEDQELLISQILDW